MSEWHYEPAPDLDIDLSERLRAFPRQPHLWMLLARSFTALLIRFWLKTYHRLEIEGRENLPVTTSCVVVANHQSHLDAPALLSCFPLKRLHRVFPAAAANYFFSSLKTSAFTSIVINGLPFDRKAKGIESLSVCCSLLDNPGNILVIFPEGTRSTTGELGRFRSGIGRLVEGSNIPVVPCNIQGAFAAFPKGSRFPRPKKIRITIGKAVTYDHLPCGRSTVQTIVNDLHARVLSLAPDKPHLERKPV